MEEAVVLGRVVVNQAVPSLRARKLLWIQPLDADGKESGAPVVAVDVTQSGPGARVFFVRSREAAQALDDPFCPVDAAILGITDESRHDLDRPDSNRHGPDRADRPATAESGSKGGRP